MSLLIRILGKENDVRGAERYLQSIKTIWDNNVRDTSTLTPELNQYFAQQACLHYHLCWHGYGPVVMWYIRYNKPDLYGVGKASFMQTGLSSNIWQTLFGY
jgi:hypothetical protein